MKFDRQQIRIGQRIGMGLFFIASTKCRERQGFPNQHTYRSNYFNVMRIYRKIDSVDINTSTLSEIVSLLKAVLPIDAKTQQFGEKAKQAALSWKILYVNNDLIK